MGEAKKRGSADERRTSAEQQGDNARRLISQGDAPHYGFILDRSEMGRKVLEQMKTGPADVRDRATSPAVQMWEAMPHFPYVVIWGSWGYSGGLTIPTADLTALLAEALPKVMERTTQKGGLCTFVPAVDPSVLEMVMGRLAELQPSTGQIH